LASITRSVLSIMPWRYNSTTFFAKSVWMNQLPTTLTMRIVLTPGLSSAAGKPTATVAATARAKSPRIPRPGVADRPKACSCGVPFSSMGPHRFAIHASSTGMQP
jgi:hypothetical protein